MGVVRTTSGSARTRVDVAARQPTHRGRDRDARAQIAGALSARFARDVTGRSLLLDGVPAVRVDVAAEVPPLGLWGPAVRLDVSGHAVEEALQ